MFIHHKVNVRVTTPCIVVHIVVPSTVQPLGLADGGGLQVKLDDNVALELAEINGAIVNHLACSRPWVWQAVGCEVV